MKMLSNENGYSLLVTLLIVLVFAVLGASLMAMTFNGTTRNDIRESVTQAQDQATKGIKRIQEQIQYELVKDIPADKGFTNSEFEGYFNAIITKYRCKPQNSNLKEVINSTEKGNGNFEVCIDNVLPYSKNAESKTIKELVFKSKGFKNGKKTTVYETVAMGSEDIQKVLNYTVSTLKKNDDGGNLYLHGGSEITGDMNIAGNIFSTNNGYGDGGWLQSVLPRSLPILNNSGDQVASKLNLGGKAFTFRNAPGRNYSYSNHLVRDFSSNEYQEIKNDNLTGIFNSNFSPQINRNFEQINPVDFDKEFKFSKQGFKTEYSDITLNGTGTINDSYIFENNLFIRGSNSGNNLKFNKNIYVKGNLVIGNTTDTSYRNLTIEGKHFYVDGNVTINKVNLQANFTIFARKSVSIQYVTISGIRDTTVPRGSLIVFSNGNFILSNLSEFQDTPSLINGFFYSSGTMELYGFGSNTKIIGGVAANNIVLNAMKGKAKRNYNDWEQTTQTGTKEECRRFWLSRPSGSEWEYQGWSTWCREVPDKTTIRKPSQEINTHYYETRENQEDATSRLQVIYNDDLLNTYRNSIDYTNTVILKESVIDPIKIDRKYTPN